MCKNDSRVESCCTVVLLPRGRGGGGVVAVCAEVCFGDDWCLSLLRRARGKRVFYLGMDAGVIQAFHEVHEDAAYLSVSGRRRQ